VFSLMFGVAILSLDATLPAPLAIGALAPARALTMISPGETDGALLGARIGVPLSKRASLSVSYDSRLGGGYTSHARTASLRLAF
jgi:uncharacterized protein with beta-barrel porin domain